ncbi:MAG: YdeI/OmpD-associated family protein [Clostridia bacterium]|nr:YdeI/OmpD-associated family protein [Clostridia bacterium]
MKKSDKNGRAASAPETFFTCDRAEWRRYLENRFESSREIWFVFPTKASGEKGISYNDAVEEALCFGWIDGRAGTLDETHHIRRFTPRRKGSAYSRPNIERLIRMDSLGLIHPKIRESVLPIISAPFVFPQDIIDELKRDPSVWENYRRFPEPYKRIRVAYIDAARKRPDEFCKRLNSFIEKTRLGKMITGYGGIGEYYDERK